ncbi:MAG TPA: histidine phosphatase family protein [Tepidisphaeraceae bacterium]|nr:histidine phosphatase family protein [Tepidisphaeraceae bacterium]
MKTRVLLVRHGATPFSAEDRFAGSTDVELSEDGRELARRLGQRLAGVKIDAVYASDMKRTVATAAIVAGPTRPPAVPVPGLREIDHGAWEGKVHKQVEKEYAAEYAVWAGDPYATAPPGGESGLHVLARALPALRKIVIDNPDRTVLVVAHKATNRLLLCALMGIDPRFYRERLAQDLACLNVIDFKDPSRAQVVVLNDTSHYATL